MSKKIKDDLSILPYLLIGPLSLGIIIPLCVIYKENKTAVNVKSIENNKAYTTAFCYNYHIGKGTKDLKQFYAQVIDYVFFVNRKKFTGSHVLGDLDDAFDKYKKPLFMTVAYDSLNPNISKLQFHIAPSKDINQDLLAFSKSY